MKISQEAVTRIDGYIIRLKNNNQEADTYKAVKDKYYPKFIEHLFYKNIDLII